MSRVLRLFSLFSMTVFSVAIFSININLVAAQRRAPLSTPLSKVYQNADLIVSGTVANPGEFPWQLRAQSAANRSFQRTLTLNVHAVIKGAAPAQISQISVVEISHRQDILARGEDVIFFLEEAAGTYYASLKLRGDLPTIARYSDRLLELQNIYLSGANIDRQLIDWAVTLAADPLTRLGGACELKGLLALEAGPAIDPTGKPEGSGIDPHGKLFARDYTACVDPNGRDEGGCINPWGRPEGSGLDPHGRDTGVCIDPQGKGDGGPVMDPNGRGDDGSGLDPHGRDEGNGFDPHGRQYRGPGMDPLGKSGPIMDPNGKPVKNDEGIAIDPFGKGDYGPFMDPNGKCGGDYTACIDPNGRKGTRIGRAITSRDDGGHLDPNDRDQGSGIDPNGKGDQGGCVDPDGKCANKGYGVDPNGFGSTINPDGRECRSKLDYGCGIDPNGKGMGLDPNGRGAMDPNGRGGICDPNGRGGICDPNGRGFGIDPNGLENDASIRIDPNGRSRGSTSGRMAGVIIDPNGRESEAGVRMDDNGISRCATKGDQGCGMDPNGRSSGTSLDPNGRGLGMDPNGRSSGTSLDPSGRLSADQKEILIQAFLGTAVFQAPFTAGDLALLRIVATFHDSRVGLVLAARAQMLHQ